MSIIKSICANNIEVQEYRNNGVKWAPMSYFLFLDRNYNMANFLLENGCPFDKNLFTISLQFNDIEILEWLKRNNCSWSKTTYKHALKYYPQFVDWLKINGCSLGFTLLTITERNFEFLHTKILS